MIFTRFLSGNPWSCDCQLKWIRTYITDHMDMIQDVGSLRCEWPYANTLMTELTVDDFNCCKIYTCKCSVSYGIKNLFVLSSAEPSIKTHPNDDSIVTNMSYTLYFEVNGSPFPNVTWYKDGEPITYDSNIYLNRYDASLHFNHTVITHSGAYYAEIQNEYGTIISNQATLIVTGIIVITCRDNYEFLNSYKEATCFNQLKDEHETDVNCGGIYCTQCNQTQVTQLFDQL